MTTMIFAFIVMLVLVSAMAIGVILGRAPISGTCGGMKALGMDVDCEICGGNPALCDTGGQVADAKTASKIEADLSTRIGR
jgi:hypothetical protein